jgi:hypothetical protein
MKDCLLAIVVAVCAAMIHDWPYKLQKHSL